MSNSRTGKGTIRIRPYAIEDKQIVISLLRLNTPEYFAPEEEQDLSYYLDHEIERYYVLESDNGIIGSGGINLQESNTAGYLSWDLVHPGFQGQGFGTLLLRFRIDRLKENRHIKKIIVRTSQLVCPFYAKSGFETVEQIKDYWAPGYDLYKMEYKAPPMG